MQKTTQEARKEEESKLKLTHAINTVYLNVDDVEISHDMPSEDKVLRLGQIATDLKKKVTELEEKRIPSTPIEVMERRRDTTTQAAKRIEEVKKICAKAIEQVSNTWESLMDDEQSHNIASHLTSVEKNIT